MPRFANPFNPSTPEGDVMNMAAQALFMGPTPYEIEGRAAKAYSQAQQARLYDAQRLKHEAQTALLEAQGRLVSPEGLRETVALGTQTPVEGVQNYEDYIGGRLQPGKMPPAGPVIDRLAPALQAGRYGVMTGTKSVADIAKGQGEFIDQGVAQGAREGTIPLDRAAAILRFGKEAPFKAHEWGTESVFTGGRTTTPYGEARVRSEDAQARERGAHAGLYSAQAAEQGAINRAGVGGRFGQLLLTEGDNGPVWTPPQAAANQRAGFKPTEKLVPVLNSDGTTIYVPQSEASGRTVPSKGKPAAVAAIPGGNATITRMQDTIGTWDNGSGLDRADRDLIVAAATRMATDPQDPFFRNPDGALEQIGREINIESNTFSKNRIKDRAAFLQRFPTSRGVQAPPPAAGGAGAPASTGAVTKGATATNPRTGQKIIFDGAKWVPVA